MLDCIFCKIINGEIPCHKIYENDDFIVFLDINPKTVGHALVVPKKHSKDILEIDDKLYVKMMVLIKELSGTLKTILKADGIKIVSNNGIAASQEIFHTHVHIIPYYSRSKSLINYKNNLPTFETKIKILVSAHTNQNESMI